MKPDLWLQTKLVEATMTLVSRVAKESKSPSYTDVNSFNLTASHTQVSQNIFLGVIDFLQQSPDLRFTYKRTDCLGNPRHLHILIAISHLLLRVPYHITILHLHNTSLHRQLQRLTAIMAISSSTTLPIIISGTGPSALLLAHALLKATPPLPFRLYERDKSMTYRVQGYRFVVSGRGVKSCRDVLSPEHFDLLRATCGDVQTPPPRRFDAVSGDPLPGFDMKFKPRRGDTQEEPLKVDRTLMRQALFRGLEDYTTFGKEIVGYEPLNAGEDETGSTNGAGDGPGVLVRFSDNSTVRGSLLVGADGGFSRVRAQLVPDVQLLDCGMRMVLGKTPLTPAFYEALGASSEDDPHAATLLESIAFVADPVPRNSPMFFMFDPMRFGGRAKVEASAPDLGASIPLDYIYWALSLRSDEPEAQGRDWKAMDSGAAGDLAEDLTKSWALPLRTLVKHQDRSQTQALRSSIIPIPLLDWRESAATDGSENSETAKISSTSSPMVTLIGDAAHAQPPTGGMGASTALTDAAVLGASLTEHGITRHALEVYEAEMRDYAGPAIEGSLKGGKIFANMKDLEEMEPMRH